MFEIEKVSARQAYRYGPFIREFKVLSDEPIAMVADKCLHFFGRPLPAETEWKKSVMIGAEHGDDPAYYFNGYYNLTVVDSHENVSEYSFKITEPYAD